MVNGTSAASCFVSGKISRWGRKLCKCIYLDLLVYLLMESVGRKHTIFSFVLTYHKCHVKLRRDRGRAIGEVLAAALHPVITHEVPVVTAVERHSFPRPLSWARCLASTVDRLIDCFTVCSITANCWFCSRMVRCHAMPSPGQSINLPYFCWSPRRHTHTHTCRRADRQTPRLGCFGWYRFIIMQAMNRY